ncbi:MAG TPA: FAD-dependent oxidoreductase [Bacteroidia bacterium]|nr:FAD-dependent oxidoreductase [Bacteroidia bacterium]
MISSLSLSLSPSEAFSENEIKNKARLELGLSEKDELHIVLQKRSIDSRQKNIKVNVTIQAFVNEPLQEEEIKPAYKNVADKKQIVIIGAGPAGLFAALRCLELGLKPILFERGKDVKTRRRDLAAINKEHIVNPESNYCFGEGGAGTYSDGKLYTRSSKRGDVVKILKTLVYHGADKTILVDAHPHIGTNKLPKIIETIRQTIIDCGGEIYFNAKLTDIIIEKGQIKSIEISHLETNTTTNQKADYLILATGHSARDIYYLLNAKNIAIEAKPFAMGVRVEHPQEIIDSIQYHCNINQLKNVREFLPAASYSLVNQVNGKGVYSFCMCPGGIIAPCATDVHEVVTNGWSPSKRNNPYANSGIVVGLDTSDWKDFDKQKNLAALALQQQLENKAWVAGGKTQTAPAQRLIDFIENKNSSTLPDCSYQPGITSVPMLPVLGNVIGKTLQEGFKNFGAKMKSYLTNEAVIVGVESRTSTPVRIPRDKETCQHTQIKGLYPCGEGAGYAGGIVSAAMDGERCVNEIFKLISK